MSDKSKVLESQLGTPLVWMKNANDEIIKDSQDNPLSDHLVDFNYSYDEENDDECKFKFRFGDVENTNNIIYTQDSIIKVQWGYLTTGGLVIKSPTRTIAVRDIKANYSESDITIELICTDLISYIKNVKTNTVKTTKYFVDWLKEISEGKFKATITAGGYVTLIDKQGTVKDFEFDEKTNSVTQKAVDNARFETRKTQLSFRKILKGKSLAINNAIDDLIKDLPDGPYIQDTTDDVLEIKPRNFKQDVFKTFTRGGLTGELLIFKSKTDTKKIKEDKKYSVKVDPKKKIIKEEEVDTAETGLSEYIRRTTGRGNLSKQPNQDEIDQWLTQAREIFDYNIANPTSQRDVPDLTYKRTVVDVENHMGQRTAIPKIYTFNLPAKEILNDPELEDEFTSSRLTNTAIQKLQRKYEADCKIIGDPTLIKGKVYQFSNLSRSDTGKWYSTKVEHKINGSGYIVEMEMVKVPSSIFVNSAKLDTTVSAESEEIKTDVEDSMKETEYYSYKEFQDKVTADKLDTELERIQERNSTGFNMINRSKILTKEREFIEAGDDSSDDEIRDVFEILNIKNIPALNPDIIDNQINVDEF